MKKILALLLALVMVFALAACGNKPVEKTEVVVFAAASNYSHHDI